MKQGGKAFIIVGGTGQGKTTFIKNRIKKVNPLSLHLYDVNAEYKEIINKPLESFEKFTEKSARLENCVIVFEEATIFIGNKGSNKKLYEILVRKRHTQNVIFLVFHSFRFIPRYIYNLCNEIVIFKTNDSQSVIDSKFEHEPLSRSFERVKKAPKYYYEIIPIS